LVLQYTKLRKFVYCEVNSAKISIVVLINL